MKEIKLNVTGIMCHNCVNKINTAISDTVGCENSIVSADFSNVYVKFNEEQISADQIKEIIEHLKNKTFQVMRVEEL